MFSLVTLPGAGVCNHQFMGFTNITEVIWSWLITRWILGIMVDVSWCIYSILCLINQQTSYDSHVSFGDTVLASRSWWCGFGACWACWFWFPTCWCGNSALFSGGDFGSCGSRWRRQGAANEAGGLRETTGDVVVGFTGWQFLTLCELENPYGNYGLVIFGRYISITGKLWSSDHHKNGFLCANC